MKIDVQLHCDSSEEAIIALQAIQEMGNAADVNGDDSDAPRSIISIMQGEAEMQDNFAQDAHDAHDVHEELVTYESLEGILIKHHIHCRAGSTSWNVIGGEKTFRRIYSYLGFDKSDFLLDVDMGAWVKGHSGGVQRFDGAILKELAAFIELYWDYGIDKDMLIRHISKAVTSSQPITPGDFKATITERPGEATLRLYNSGVWGKNRLPDLTRRERLA